VKGGGWGPPTGRPTTELAVFESTVNEATSGSVDVATGEAARDPEGPGEGRLRRRAWTADGKGLYVTTDRESEFQRLAHLDLATGKHTYLVAHPWDVDSFALSPTGRRSLRDERGGPERPAPARRGHRKEKPAPKLPVGLIGAEWHNNGRDLGLSSPRLAPPPTSTPWT
jgi:hypothetical protein